MSKRPLAALLLTALISLNAPAASALTGVESCFLSAIARARASAGRTALSVRSDLISIARRHSDRMARDGRIYHSSDLGNGVSGNWTKIGENVGKGPDCSSIHRAFMESSSHRTIILGRSYNQVGVGVAWDSDTIYVTEVFLARAGSGARPVVSRSRPRPTRPQKPVAKKLVAPKPVAKPRNVAILLTLLSLDVARVNPSTGRAVGV